MANTYWFCLVAFLCCTDLSTAQQAHNHCFQGPSVWCQSLSTSWQCHATHHCATNVWNKMVLPEDKSLICNICTTVVQEARDVISNKDFQEKVKQLLALPCQEFRLPLIAKGCMMLVGKITDVVMNIYASAMNPLQVCSIVELCNSANIDRSIKQFVRNIYETVNRTYSPAQKYLTE